VGKCAVAGFEPTATTETIWCCNTLTKFEQEPILRLLNLQPQCQRSSRLERFSK
jgi:hypothetical protein